MTKARIGATLLALSISASAMAWTRSATPREHLTHAGIPLLPLRLVEALSHPDPAVRMWSAIVVGDDEIKPAIPGLRQLLDQPLVPNIRLAAAGSLLKMGDESGLPILLATMRHGDPDAAAAASGEILRAGRPDGFELLLEQLPKPRTLSHIRSSLLTQIAEYKRFPKHRPVVLSTIVRALRDDPSADVREPAAQAALARAAEHDPAANVRFHAKLGIRPVRKP